MIVAYNIATAGNCALKSTMAWTPTSTDAPTPAGSVLAIPLTDERGEVLGGLDLLSIDERSWTEGPGRRPSGTC